MNDSTDIIEQEMIYNQKPPRSGGWQRNPQPSFDESHDKARLDQIVP